MKIENFERLIKEENEKTGFILIFSLVLIKLLEKTLLFLKRQSTTFLATQKSTTP